MGISVDGSVLIKGKIERIDVHDEKYPYLVKTENGNLWVKKSEIIKDLDRNSHGNTNLNGRETKQEVFEDMWLAYARAVEQLNQLELDTEDLSDKFKRRYAKALPD